ncbi:MAG: thymidine phosphorylase family protein [Nanoarchaeota archaeon]
MKFRVKDLDLATGGPHIAALHKKDARHIDSRSGDRIIVKYGKKEVTCILDIAESKRELAPGSIGLFEEVLDKLKVKNGSIVELKFTGKPESVNHIREKLFGKQLCYEQLFRIADDITNDRLTEIEKTYFVSACFAHGLSIREIVDLTKALVLTGDKLKFGKLTLDKHCIGGIPGNRTTMVVIPIIAAAGFIIPKTSSRAITSPAGTADTMECLAKVELPPQKIKKIVKKNGACIVHGGSMNLAPADDKIIEVEHPLSIDAEGQLLASVLAKKYSVSADHVLIDIPMVKSSKAKNWKEANHLKERFELIGKKLGMNVKVIVTDGSRPIGRGIGPLFEAEDVMSVLRNDSHAPQDLRKKALFMAGVLLEMTGKYKKGEGEKAAIQILNSGKAWVKMNNIIDAQGRQKKPPRGKFTFCMNSNKTGKIIAVDNDIVAKIARIAGCPQDKGAGLILHKNVGDLVKKGELLYTVYAYNQFKLNLAKELICLNCGYGVEKS